MRTAILKICRNGKYLGLLGLPSLFSDALIFDYLWLFWLLGFVEIALDFSFFKQNFQLLIGMLSVPAKYGKSIPDKDNYHTDIEVSLPFAGPWAVVNGGVDKKFSHSWEIPCQRYAHDFLILDQEGKSFSGPATEAGSYYCYSRDILAPAGGVVEETRDNEPDSRIFGTGKPDCAAKDIRGNYILIRHDEHTYSLLAHLKKGTLTVQAGDPVEPGQKLAQCGNSGNSTEPHLHFQMQNGKSFAFSAGLPIRFSAIKCQPCPNYAAYDKRQVPESPPEPGYIVRGLLVEN